MGKSQNLTSTIAFGTSTYKKLSTFEYVGTDTNTPYMLVYPIHFHTNKVTVSRNNENNVGLNAPNKSFSYIAFCVG